MSSQGLKSFQTLGLQDCRQIFHCLSHQGSPLSNTATPQMTVLCLASRLSSWHTPRLIISRGLLDATQETRRIESYFPILVRSKRN